MVLDETRVSNKMQKHVEFHFSQEIYEFAQPGITEIEIKHDVYLVTHH